MPDQVRHDGKGGKTAKMGTDGLLTSVPVFREDRDPDQEHVRMTQRDCHSATPPSCHPVMVLYGISIFKYVISARNSE
jgi:hypothetical protein